MIRTKKKIHGHNNTHDHVVQQAHPPRLHRLGEAGRAGLVQAGLGHMVPLHLGKRRSLQSLRAVVEVKSGNTHAKISFFRSKLLLHKQQEQHS